MNKPEQAQDHSYRTFGRGTNNSMAEKREWKAKKSGIIFLINLKIIQHPCLDELLKNSCMKFTGLQE